MIYAVQIRHVMVFNLLRNLKNEISLEFKSFCYEQTEPLAVLMYSFGAHPQALLGVRIVHSETFFPIPSSYASSAHDELAYVFNYSLWAERLWELQ